MSNLPKDFEPEEIPLICQKAIEHNVAIVVGEQDERGNVNDVGSGRFTFEDEIAAVLGGDAGPPPPPGGGIGLTNDEVLYAAMAHLREAHDWLDGSSETDPALTHIDRARELIGATREGE